MRGRQGGWLTNAYGPHGSQYSPTSIFNEYSQYGSVYGQYSLNNPYAGLPPKLTLNGRFVGHVSANEYIPDRISPKAFQFALKNRLASLLRGEVPTSEAEVRAAQGEAYIQAADGTFLGSLNPNNFDTDSIFNKYGPHGSKYASNSIFNKYSPYGGSYSAFSPFNTRTQSPPKIVQKGQMLAYLTVNERLQPRIDPAEVFDWARRNIRKRFA